jgi:hypothetical protein
MTTRLFENGRDLGVISAYERHGGPPDWCAFKVPLASGLGIGKATEHALSFDNGSTVPIRVTRVTGGIEGACVTAYVP